MPGELPDVNGYLKALRRKQREERKLCSRMLQSREIYPDKTVEHEVEELNSEEATVDANKESGSISSWLLLPCCRRRQRPRRDL